MAAPEALGCLAGVFAADGRSLVKGLPDLDQATLGTIAHKSLVGSSAKSDVIAGGFVRLPVGRVWMLKPGATLDRVPAGERKAALTVLRRGQGMLLLAPDPETERAMREALLALTEGDDGDGELVGHA